MSKKNYNPKTAVMQIVWREGEAVIIGKGGEAMSKGKPEDYDGADADMQVGTDFIKVCVCDGDACGVALTEWTVEEARKVRDWLNEAIEWMDEQ